MPERVPQPGEHPLPFSVSVQLRLPVPGSLFTLPLTVSDAATCTVADEGETDTESAGMVIVAIANFVGSAAALALRVTVKSVAGGPGAVNVVDTPFVVDPGDTDPQEAAEQATVHITPLLLTSFTRVAVNGSVLLSSSVELVVSNEILIAGGGGVADAPPQPRLAAARAAARNTPGNAARFVGDITASIQILKCVGMPARNGAFAPQSWPQA